MWKWVYRISFVERRIRDEQRTVRRLNREKGVGRGREQTQTRRSVARPTHLITHTRSAPPSSMHQHRRLSLSINDSRSPSRASPSTTGTAPGPGPEEQPLQQRRLLLLRRKIIHVHVRGAAGPRARAVRVHPCASGGGGRTSVSWRRAFWGLFEAYGRMPETEFGSVPASERESE